MRREATELRRQMTEHLFLCTFCRINKNYILLTMRAVLLRQDEADAFVSYQPLLPESLKQA